MQSLSNDPVTRKQQIQDRQAVALKQSFPGRLCETLSRTVVHSYTLNSKKLAAQCEKHNAAVEDLRQRAHAGIDELRAALSTADDSEGYGKLFEAIEASHQDRAELAREVVLLAVAAGELSISVSNELEPKVAELELEAQKTIDNIKQQLWEIGSGPENHPGYSSNPDAVERAFAHQVRTHNIFARTAIEAAGNARNESESARQQSYRRAETINEAKRVLHELALQAINA